MAQNDTPQVTDEFIQQSLEYSQIKRVKKNGGPYSKHDRDKRRDEVYRLHFEYGYPARKIADLMNISRHTINGDVDYWYSSMFQKVNILNPESDIIVIVEQMKTQLTSLRERLDKTSNHSEWLSIHRLIYEIRSKIFHIYQKLSESAFRVNKITVESLNRYMKDKKKPDRFITLFDLDSVSQNAEEKIRKIIKEDGLKRNLKKKF